jgi:hypothetical protein
VLDAGTQPCDLVLMSGGFTPSVHLHSQSRGKLVWHEGLQAFLPGEPADPNKVPPWGRWFRQVEALPHEGEVVMTGPNDRPLLVLDRVGDHSLAVDADDRAARPDRRRDHPGEQPGPAIQVERGLSWRWPQPGWAPGCWPLT